MRFGLTHRLTTNLLALIGLLSVLTSGKLEPLLAAVVLAAMILASLVPERVQETRFTQRLAIIGPLVLLATELLRLAYGHPFLLVAVEFALLLQVLRIATRQGTVHDQQILLLACLHLITGAALGGGLLYGACFVAFVAVVPGALVLSHLRREVEGNYRQGARDRSGSPVDVPRILRSQRVISWQFLLFTSSMCVPVLLVTSVLFLAFPRVGLSLVLVTPTSNSRIVGFSDRVDLGGVGTLRTDPTIAMRVDVLDVAQPPPDRIQLYLRGTALDYYDGRTWQRTSSAAVPVPRAQNRIPVFDSALAQPAASMVIDLEPFDPPVLFLPPNAAAIEPRTRADRQQRAAFDVLQAPQHEYRYSSSADRNLTYAVYLSAQPHPLTMQRGTEHLSQYLAVPRSHSSELRQLAYQWTDGATTILERAAKVEQKLRLEYRYDLNSPSSERHDPLYDFLFESKRGHCEYFSTAMAILLRYVDVPTRNVTGFVGGTYNRFGQYYTVRQGDAHSWVEVYDPQQGWVRFDPTPPVAAQSLIEANGWRASARDILEALDRIWKYRVLGYGLPQQQRLWKQTTNWFSDKTDAIRKAQRFVFDRSPVRSYWFVVGLVLVAAALAFRKHRGRAKRVKNGSQTVRAPRYTAEKEATALYEALQDHMNKAGIGRPGGTPPLKHAQMLLDHGHLHAQAVAEVTSTYLSARFGDTPLDAISRARSLELIRSIRPPRAG